MVYCLMRDLDLYKPVKSIYIKSTYFFLFIFLLHIGILVCSNRFSIVFMNITLNATVKVSTIFVPYPILNTKTVDSRK